MFAQDPRSAVQLVQELQQLAFTPNIVIRLPQDFCGFLINLAHVGVLGGAFPYFAKAQFAYDEDGLNLSPTNMIWSVNTQKSDGTTSAGTGSGNPSVTPYMQLIENLAGPGSAGFGGLIEIQRPLGASHVFSQMLAADAATTVQFPNARGYIPDVGLKSLVISGSSGTIQAFAKVFGFKDGGLI